MKTNREGNKKFRKALIGIFAVVIVLTTLLCGGGKDDTNPIQEYLKFNAILNLITPRPATLATRPCTNDSVQPCSNSTGTEIKITVPYSVSSSTYTVEILTPKTTSTVSRYINISSSEEFWSPERQCIVRVENGTNWETKLPVQTINCKVDPKTISYQVNIVTATKYVSSYVSSLSNADLSAITLKDIPLSGQECSVSGLDQNVSNPGTCNHPTFGTQRRIYYRSNNFYACLIAYSTLRAKYPNDIIDEPTIGTLPATTSTNNCSVDTTSSLLNNLANLIIPTIPSVSNTTTGTGTGTGTGTSTGTGNISLSYSGSPFTFANGSSIITQTPTISGWITSCAANPTLPTGLSIHPNTCAISGTPTEDQAATSYTITARNSAGSKSTTITIAIMNKPSINYANSPFTVTQNSYITMTPTVSGTITSCTANPSLPTGLTINTTNCVISGTPTLIQAANSYTITANNSAGNATTNIMITVNLAAPSYLLYTGSPYTFSNGVTIISKTPTVNGTVTSCTANPSLPAGLLLNATTCTISGTPTVDQTAITHKITASNDFGSTTSNIVITVNKLPPSALTYVGSPYSYTKGYSIGTNTPTVTGGLTNCTASPILPSGLSLSTTTCALSGSPTTIQSAANYTITASNPYGNTTTIISITVKIPPPSGLTYYGTPFSFTKNSAITTQTPNLTGTVTSCSSSPSLPSGLSINATTCAISGTPTINQFATYYTITASNSTGSATAGISIAVTSPVTSGTCSYDYSCSASTPYSCGSYSPCYASSYSCTSSAYCGTGTGSGTSSGTSTGSATGTGSTSCTGLTGQSYCNCVQGGAYPYYCSTDNTCYLNSSYCGGSSGGSTCGSGCGGYAGLILCTGTRGASGCSCGASDNCPTSCCGR